MLDHCIPPACHWRDLVRSNLMAKLRRSASMQTATTVGQAQPLVAFSQPGAAQSAFLWLAPEMMPLGQQRWLDRHRRW
jgi:hypothetical protein